MRLPSLPTWKILFRTQFSHDFHPQHWITQEGKQKILEAVNACQTWEDVRKVAPWKYVPQIVRDHWAAQRLKRLIVD